MSSLDSVSARIVDYRNRAHVTRRSHYMASGWAERKGQWLGVPVVIISAVVGTSIFGTLQANPDIYLKIGAGVLSISAAVLAALQTYLGYAEKAAKHKEAGAKYAAIWRSLDLLELELSNSGDQFCDRAIEKLTHIVATLDETAESSPSLPDGAYKIAAAELREKLQRANNSIIAGPSNQNAASS